MSFSSAGDFSRFAKTVFQLWDFAISQETDIGNLSRFNTGNPHDTGMIFFNEFLSFCENQSDVKRAYLFFMRKHGKIWLPTDIADASIIS